MGFRFYIAEIRPVRATVRGRAIPCSDCAKQRHDIIPNRLALTTEESVSGVTGATAQVNQETPPMRIYIIGNNEITLYREPPATLNKGEVAVASREELHAARLSGKRLLALWNALPGVEKQTKVGDRETLIDQLWSAIEALPDPDQPSDTKRPSKQEAADVARRQYPDTGGHRVAEARRGHHRTRPAAGAPVECRPEANLLVRRAGWRRRRLSGYVLIFPFYGTTIETMQQAEMVHSIVAMLFIATMLAHIYIGTIGMEAEEALGF